MTRAYKDSKITRTILQIFRQQKEFDQRSQLSKGNGAKIYMRVGR